MARVTAEQRRAALRKRTERSVNERDQRGLGRKSILDYSKAGNRKIGKYEVKSGKETNYIDILPFEITQDWYKDLRSKPGSSIGLDVGFTDYKLEIPVHKKIGENNDMFLCPRLAFGKKCPICEELYAEYDKEDHDQNEKKINSLTPGWRCFYNIYDYDGSEKGIQLWEDVAYGNFEKYLQEAAETSDDGIVTFSDLEIGSSIEFKGRDKKFGKNPYVEAHSFVFKSREVYSEDILKETFPLDAMLVVSDYEHIAKVHLGMEDDSSPEKTEDSAPEAQGRSRFKEEMSEPSKKEEEKPWVDCPAGYEFGVDCNAKKECGSCEEAVFQACVAKQDEMVKASKEDVKEEEKSTSSRSRKKETSSGKATSVTSSAGRTRKRRR